MSKLTAADFSNKVLSRLSTFGPDKFAKANAIERKPPARVPLAPMVGRDEGAGQAEAPRANSELRFTIWGQPVGKPRMTQRDKWAKRPAVMRYRAWADTARAASARSLWPQDPVSIECHAYLPMPKSWPLKKRNQMSGQLHRQKPDADNILKAACDSLFKEDCRLAEKRIVKRWSNAEDARLEVTLR